MDEQKLHPICPDCKSKNIEMREFKSAPWNSAINSWGEEPNDYEAYEYCNPCGSEIRVEWVSLSAHNKAPWLEG